MKICKECSISKEESEFDIKTNGSISGHCKDCRRNKVKKHYENNKQYYFKKATRLRNIEIKKYNEYKRTLFCEDCKISFKEESYLCDFHHIDETNKNQNPAYFRSNFKGFLKEIKGCLPLCANCHRRRHHMQD